MWPDKAALNKNPTHAVSAVAAGHLRELS
jgi:hypothetical protein